MGSGGRQTPPLLFPGTAVDSVQKLPPGEEITYSALSTDKPTSWAKVEAKITLEFAQ